MLDGQRGHSCTRPGSGGDRCLRNKPLIYNVLEQAEGSLSKALPAATARVFPRPGTPAVADARNGSPGTSSLRTPFPPGGIAAGGNQPLCAKGGQASGPSEHRDESQRRR